VIVPEQIKPCAATGPSCTDDGHLIFGIPIALMAMAAFGVIAARGPVG